MRPILLTGGLIFVVITCSACSRAGGVAFESTPAGQLRATITTDPPPRDDGTVPRDARWVVELDDYVDPDSVLYGALVLRSGKGSFDFRWDIEVVDRRVVVTPRSLLLAGAEYTLA